MPNYEVLKDSSIDGFPNAKAGMVIALSEEVAALHVEAGELALSTDEAAKVYVPGMQPTAGRIVYYKDGELYPAIVTSVGEGGKLSLLVAYLQGWSPKHGVVQGGEAGMWDWMPFQKDQQLRAGYVHGGIGGMPDKAKTEVKAAEVKTETADATGEESDDKAGEEEKA